MFSRQFPSDWHPSLYIQTRTSEDFLPFLEAWTLLDNKPYGLQERTPTYPHTHTYAESIWEGYSPTYLLDSPYHFLDVGVVDLSLEPVDIIAVL